VKKSVQGFNEYISTVKGSSLNEGFLDAVLRFFKGIFDLFNNKDLKKEVEDSQSYIRRIEDDEEIEDDEIEEEIDSKRIRRSFEKASNSVKKKIEVEEEKGIRLAKELKEKLASWFAQLFVLEEVANMPIIEKMLNSKEGSKRFTWVPSEFRDKLKDWYNSPECVLNKDIRNSILEILEADSKKKEKLIEKLAEDYIKLVAESGEDGLKKLKENDADYLDDIYTGFAFTTGSIRNGMNTVIKNTNDEKIAETVAKEIKKNREKKPVKKPTKTKEKEDDDEEKESSGPRSRKGTKRGQKKSETDKSADKPAAKPDTKKSETDKSADKPAAKPDTKKEETE